MKVMLVTIPMESKPAVFPQFGALSVMNYAYKRSEHVFNFYNLDCHRNSLDKALQKIVDYNPNVVGISAVVSTAYKYTKQLATDIRRLLPDTLIVVGGNLGASAELLLRYASVDLVAVGEGEITFLNIINRAETSRKPSDCADIAGLMLLKGSGELVNMGYERPLSPEEIWNVDWDDLKADGSIDFYSFPYSKPKDYRTRYAAAHPNHAAIAATPNARKGSLTIAKGCVDRCTFCHRWDKGMRHIPVNEVMRGFELLYHDYGVRDSP
jgi:anaerobic magnesium-protoporphyrin IX monomethyl ester cyclase